MAAYLVVAPVEAAVILWLLWREDGALVRDEEPSVYLVDQTYRGPDGAEYMRRGFVARLTLAALEQAHRVRHHVLPRRDRDGGDCPCRVRRQR